MWWRARATHQRATSGTAEVSLTTPIVEADHAAKPTRAQCGKFAEDLEHHVEDRLADAAHVAESSQVDRCMDVFSVATLKCVTAGDRGGTKISELNDPYGCVTEHPRR